MLMHSPGFTYHDHIRDSINTHTHLVLHTNDFGRGVSPEKDNAALELLKECSLALHSIIPLKCCGLFGKIVPNCN